MLPAIEIVDTRQKGRGPNTLIDSISDAARGQVLRRRDHLLRALDQQAGEADEIRAVLPVRLDQAFSSGEVPLLPIRAQQLR